MRLSIISIALVFGYVGFNGFEEVNALKDHIPGILDSAAGFNTSPRGQGYEFGGVMKFNDRAAYEAYNAHPVHQQLLTWLLPLIDPMELDFEL